jgi:hypothetical protein
MAINKNHEFEDLEGVKCAVVEKNVKQERVDFLKSLLEFNGYTVVVVASPPPKAALAVKPAAPASAVGTVSSTAEATPTPPPPPPPSTFTVGVTDVRFNATNAIFGRLLRTPDKHVVTLAYWQQKEAVPHDEIPYFENKV